VSRPTEIASAPPSGARDWAPGRAYTIALAVLGAAIVSLYVPVLRDLVGVWLDVTYYSYGFVVPLFSAYLAWDTMRAHARQTHATGARPLDAWGLLVIVVGVAVLAIGVTAESLTLRALSLPVVLLGVARALGGPALARSLAFPIGFLVFIAPLPDGTLPALSLPLQRLAADVAEQALRALGVSVTRHDLFLQLPSVTLHVTDACNGLRFLLAMIVIGVAFAATTQRGVTRRSVVVVSAIAIALLANFVRVTGTGIMAELWGPGAAIGLPHIVWGKVVYALALVPFAAVVLWLKHRS